MDGLSLALPLFLFAAFAGALVAGLSGFAFGLVAASIWLYILTPLQTATLIIAFGLVVQGYGVWQLRKALNWNRLWPFLLGAAIGVPLGVALLARADPDYVRRGVAVVLIGGGPPHSRRAANTSAAKRTRARVGIAGTCASSAGRRESEVVFYSCDASKIAAKEVTCIVLGPGNIGEAHTANESIGLDELEEGVNAYVRLAQVLMPRGT